MTGAAARAKAVWGAPFKAGELGHGGAPFFEIFGRAERAAEQQVDAAREQLGNAHGGDVVTAGGLDGLVERGANLVEHGLTSQPPR